MTHTSNPTAGTVERSASTTPVAAIGASTSRNSGVAKPTTNGTSLSQALAGSSSPSAHASPISSRDSSPARRSKPQRAASAVTSSRKNSQDTSPQRPPALPGTATTTPSAAAIQRALSATNAPQLQPSVTSDPASRLPRAQRTSAQTGGDNNTAHAPISPRLKSPPPTAGSRRNSLRTQQSQPDAPPSAPSIVIQSSTPTTSTPHLAARDNGPVASLEEVIRQPPRIERGASGAPALATVEEGSVPSTPSTEATEEQTYVFGYNVSLKWHKIDEHSLSKQTTAEYQPKRDPTADSTDNSDLSASETAEKRAESGSDSAGKKSKGKDTTKRTHNDADETPRPKAVQPKRSYTSLASIKAKSAAEPTSRKMTVETETVSSTGPSTLAGVTGDRNALNKGDAGGSLRLRPSNETIRPKKEKKKTRKAPSINSGTGRFPDAVPSPLGFHHHLHHSHSLESVRPDLRPWSQTSPTLSHFPGGADFAAANLQSYWAARFPSPESNFSYMNFLSFNFNSKIYTSNGTDHILRKASSKADIFEAKVASAVDDVNSSDSDETFVYESNPPESQPRRSRHHSRTPSATSLATIGDPRLARNLTNVLNAERGVSGKRSMKFANNPYSSSGADDDQLDRPDGTLRGGTVRPSGGSGAHHLHMTRHTRPQFEEESPFTQASKRSGAASRQSSRPTSPRIVNFRANGNGNGTPRKNEGYASYDLDADGADDERTPLIGTVRTPRGQRGSRVPANIRVRHMERFENPRSYWLKRFAGCAVMTIMVTAVVFGAVGFFFVTTKPLYEVDVKDIRNVLASEQELMVDLLIEAINPNLLTISVADMDVNVFAKSKHVGSEKWWRDHGKPPPPPMKNADRSQRDRRSLSTSSSHWVDTSDFGFDWPLPDDPDEMPEGDPQMMLLGRVLHFDNALTFDGSPIKRHLHYSVGEFRVTHPGNKTEAGGTERWERVLQDKFQLIVRGILKYNLPLSTHVIAAPIDASAMVHPEKGVDDHGRMVVGRTRSRKYPSGGDEHSPFISHDGQGVVWHGRDKDGRKEKDDKKEHMKAEEKKDREHDELEVDIPVPAERERHLRSARFNNVQA